MSSAFLIIAGAGIISFLILYLVINQPERHYLLKIIGLFFAIYFLIFIPKVINEDVNSECYWVVNETDSSITEISEVCNVPHDETALSFTKLLVWFVRIFVLYVFVYFLWDLMNERMLRLLKRYNVIGKKREKRDNAKK